MTSSGTSPAARRLEIEPFAGTVTATLSDAIIASTGRARVLRESGSDPVFYFPFEDVYFEFLQKTGTTTTCPRTSTKSRWASTRARARARGSACGPRRRARVRGAA